MREPSFLACCALLAAACAAPAPDTPLTRLAAPDVEPPTGRLPDAEAPALALHGAPVVATARPPAGPGPRPRRQTSMDKGGDEGDGKPPTGDDRGACDPGQLADLDGGGLIAWLEAHTLEGCVSLLWTFSQPEVVATLTNDELPPASTRSAPRSAAFEGGGDDPEHLREFVFYVRVREYQRFFHPTSFSGTTMEPAIIAALGPFRDNPAFAAVDLASVRVTSEWINAVDAANLHATYADELVRPLTAFDVDGASDWYRGALTYYTMSAYNRTRSQAVAPAFAEVLTEAPIDELCRIGALALQDTSARFLLPNAIYTLGRLAGFAAVAPAVQACLTERSTSITRPRPNTPGSCEPSPDVFACATSTGELLCFEEILPALEAYLFPARGEFDGVTFLGPFSKARMRQLYEELRDVRFQTDRITGRPRPLASDPNATVTFRIYGSRAAYEQFQAVMYGLPVNNGGIYMEQQGTIYTYERTPAESIFRLEALIRHEYAHYLIGRHVVAGAWGEAPIYGDGRLTFFDEGLAEFLAGSTRAAGIVPMATTPMMLAQTPAWVPLAEVPGCGTAIRPSTRRPARCSRTCTRPAK
ncbi:MAG: collagenase [Kofleriaceae bacterium]